MYNIFLGFSTMETNFDGLGRNSFPSVVPLVHLNHNYMLENQKCPYKDIKKCLK